jgi:rhamnulokinase
MDGKYLALDLGAESGRAMFARLAEGKIELTELHRFANTPVQLPTGLYWDTLRLFHEICEGIRASCKAADELDGLAIDTWGVDFGLIGNGELLHNPRHYRDARTDGVMEEVFVRVPRIQIYEQTGLQFMPINSLYQLYCIQRDSPELLDAASQLLFMPDLFNYFLTGTVAVERTIASTSQFYDPTRKAFATDLLRQLDISAKFLPGLIDPGMELGSVLPYVAERCGLKHDLKVYTAGSHDTASAVAAVPAQPGENWCYISSGTWSLMGIELQRPLINDTALEANFTNEVGVDSTIRFLKNIPGLWLLQECRRAWAKEGHDYSYADLMQRASTARSIDTILDLDQFLSPGNHPRRICEFCRKTQQEAPQDPGSTTRVILQSLAARYAEVLNVLEQLTGRSLEVVHIVGGGSQNRLLNQLTANAIGRRVIAGPSEATAAGNALTQAMGADDINSLEELRSVVRASFSLEEFRPQN